MPALATPVTVLLAVFHGGDHRLHRWRMRLRNHQAHSPSLSTARGFRPPLPSTSVFPIACGRGGYRLHVPLVRNKHTPGTSSPQALTPCVSLNAGCEGVIFIMSPSCAATTAAAAGGGTGGGRGRCPPCPLSALARVVRVLWRCQPCRVSSHPCSLDAFLTAFPEFY